MFKCKLFILLFSCFLSSTTFGQPSLILRDLSNASDTSGFSLYYGFSGLGSNMGRFEPTIRIKGTNFLYTYEQNSYYVKKDKRVDTVCVKVFRQTSIDSIVEIIRDLRDTTIREYNFCIMSGGIHFVTIANGLDTTNFELSNTFDYAALKIANILNDYIPCDKQLWADKKMIEDAKACLTNLLENIEADKNKKTHLKKKNGT